MMKIVLALVCVGLASAQLNIPTHFDMSYTTTPFDQRFASDGTTGFITVYAATPINTLRSDVYVDGNLYNTFVENANGVCVAKFVQIQDGAQKCTQVNLDQETCNNAFLGLEGQRYKEVGVKTLPWGEKATVFSLTLGNVTSFIAVGDEGPVGVGGKNPMTGEEAWFLVVGFHAPGVTTPNFFNPPSNCVPAVEPEHKAAVTNKVMKSMPFAVPGPPKASCRHKPGTRPCCLFSPDRFRVSHTFAGFEGRECQPNFFDPYCGYACVDVFDCSESKISYCTTG